MTIAPPSPPYLGPAKFHGDADNQPIHRIVIHGTVSPCVEGGARIVARYFRTTVTRPSSAHYVVDPAEAVQCVYDSVVAYHAPPNEHSIGVELCDMVDADPDRWGDENHRRMLARAAKLVARLCLHYGVPIRKVGPAELRNGIEGICGHVDVSNAWHQTDHHDPGDGFPWARFIDMVQNEAAELKRGTATDPPDARQTRVNLFERETNDLLQKYLDPAIADGREGVVQDVRHEIKKQLNRLPDR